MYYASRSGKPSVKRGTEDGRGDRVDGDNDVAQSLVRFLLRALLLKDRGSDAVEVALAVNRDAAAATSGVLLKNTDLLEGLEDLALDCDFLSCEGV